MGVFKILYSIFPEIIKEKLSCFGQSFSAWWASLVVQFVVLKQTGLIFKNGPGIIEIR